MTRSDIIAVRRKLRVPEQFQGQWTTLVDVGFDGDWVSPIQKTSNSTTGPLLVAKHWFDAESANRHRAILERCGYLPDIPFNRALDRVLEAVGLTREEIYITQACHFLPRTDRRQSVPAALMRLSIEAVTRYEVEGRRVIALGGEAQRGFGAGGRRFHPMPTSEFIDCRPIQGVGKRASSSRALTGRDRVEQTSPAVSHKALRFTIPRHRTTHGRAGLGLRASGRVEDWRATVGVRWQFHRFRDRLGPAPIATFPVPARQTGLHVNVNRKWLIFVNRKWHSFGKGWAWWGLWRG